MKINLMYLFLITIFIFTSCAKEDVIYEDVFITEDSEIETRRPSCNYTPVSIDENGCCVYYFPYQEGRFHIINGNSFTSGSYTVCEGEEVLYQWRTTKYPNFDWCTDLLTCTCCDQIEYDITYHSEEPNCCRIEIDFNRPECVDSDVFSSVKVNGLNDDFTVNTIQQNETGHDIRICGPGEYPEGTTLFIQFKIDNECKSDKVYIPIVSCY